MKHLFLLSVLIFSPIYPAVKEIVRPLTPDIFLTKAREIVRSLTLEERIGQLFVVAATSDLQGNRDLIMEAHVPYIMDQESVELYITKYHVGGVLFLLRGKPDKQVALTRRFQSLSKLPLLIAQDFEWGLSMRLDDTVRFPRNMTLGALADDNLIYRMGFEVARQCKILGVHINFAPVVDVNNNPNNPVINDRSFGENKEAVARKAALFMRGLQDGGVIACAKHFPGHGDTAVDSHRDLPVILHDIERLHAIELYPFVELINAGVRAVMTAHLEIHALDATPHLPAGLSYAVVTELLQQQLGFNGLVLTDGLGMAGVTKYHEPGELELKALLAGSDILLCPVDVPKAFEIIKQAVLDGTFLEEELNRRVTKIMVNKLWVMQNGVGPQDVESLGQALNTQAAYELKTALYEQAVTVVRNNNNLLPLDSSAQEPVTIIQIGGQKSSFITTLNELMPVSPYYVSAQATEQQVEELMSKIGGVEKVIIVPYEMNKFSKKNFGVSPSTLQLLERLRAGNKKIILMLFGNPYSIALFGPVDALVVGYEDDEDSQKAAARVVVGNLVAQGILPIKGVS